jgi:NADPH:quinone reductase-like Zn-dependent oxidoreductase
VRAVRLKQFGLDGLVVDEIPEPAPGPGELLLRVRAVSLNYRDLLIVRGEYDPRLPLPLVPCSDAVCDVVAVGAGVDGARVGERVCPNFSRGWYDGPPTRETPRRSLGAIEGGTLAELIVTSAGDVVKPPAYLEDTEAATLPCAGLTAYRALFEHARTGPQSRVLVLGTGGVSTFALLLAKAAGADVTVISRDPDKLERALALGADRGLCSANEPEWGKKVRDATDGGVDQVIDVLGGATLTESLQAVRPGATISLVGSSGGRRGATASVSLLPAIMREVRLQGILVGPRSSFLAFVAALERYRIRPVVDSTFSFAEVRTAFEHLESGRAFGKVTITVT